MNYLAHAYLSFRQPDILAGNLISDFVKGKKKLDYTAGIQKGIDLHRAIDQYTDTHEATRQAKEVFRPHYRLYAGAFIDVVYDHFLAIDDSQFPGDSLMGFSQEVYAQMEPFLSQMPERFRAMFPYMKSQNWLFNYQYRDGMQRSFGGLVRRAAYLEDSATALELFDRHYARLHSCYRLFFPDVFGFAKNWLQNNVPPEGE